MYLYVDLQNYEFSLIKKKKKKFVDLIYINYLPTHLRLYVFKKIISFVQNTFYLFILKYFFKYENCMNV